jgi:hypothetical protein
MHYLFFYFLLQLLLSYPIILINHQTLFNLAIMLYFFIEILFLIIFFQLHLNPILNLFN